MKKSSLKLFLYIFSFLFLTIGCDKQYAKKLSGRYACSVHYVYWDMTPKNVDTTYFEELEITREGKNVVILGKSIHIDSLWKEKEYKEEFPHYFFKVLFRNDSIYVTNGGGGLGGFGSHTYSGLKKK